MGAILVWFRRDLRLTDNPALHEAVRHGKSIIPVYIHAPAEAGAWADGAASLWWLHYSLEALDRSLRQRGSRLVIRIGSSVSSLLALAKQAGAATIFCNRVYDPILSQRDGDVARALNARGITLHLFNGGLLYEPPLIETKQGTPYKVFAAFWKACERAPLDLKELHAPASLPPINQDIVSQRLDALTLLPKPRWDDGLRAVWRPGEVAAKSRLRVFCKTMLHRYAECRDYPAWDATSHLSPHIHFGEIGPRQVYATVKTWAGTGSHDELQSAKKAFLRELGFREFAHHLLYHFPQSTDHPLDPRFEHFPWAKRRERQIYAWQNGETGYPLVDAGMRQLWRTGWMHNRVRMVVASFLVKDCLVPWQTGARWFWDTLVDADLANNTFNWQWVAGSGADAAPFFRVFNPLRQSEKFDPDGNYVRRWLPELARLPSRWLHQPWNAPAGVLTNAGVILGTTYPQPIVGLSVGRARALAAFNTIKRIR